LAGQDLSILVSKNQTGTESDFQNQNWNQIKRKEKKGKKTRPRIGFSALFMCGIRTTTTIHVFEKEKCLESGLIRG
jgi:hypothetical protein